MTLLCPDCFDNVGLKRRLIEVRPQYENEKCTYHPTKKGIPIEDVCQIIDEVFRNNYTIGGGDYQYYDPEEHESYFTSRGESLDQVVWGLVDPVSEDIAEAVVQQLVEGDNYWPPDGEEPFYSTEFNYERVDSGTGNHARIWQRFCESIVHEQRFFNSEASGLLEEIFDRIHIQRDRARRSPVYELLPEDGRHFHRARVVTSADLKKVKEDPAGQLGPPPRRLGKPNRMNPSGVRAFYGSFDRTTCISELRPDVGEQVAVATFEILRPIVVLDMTRFVSPPKETNLFMRDHNRRLSQWRFMQRFMIEMSKPISKGEEHLDYVPTQVVAEYLNRVYKFRLKKDLRNIDAIIYASAQRPTGVNIVILGDAAFVKKMDNSRRKEGPTGEAITFDLEFFSLGPRNPGLSMREDSLRVIKTKGVEYAEDGEEDIEMLVDPPF